MPYLDINNSTIPSSDQGKVEINTKSRKAAKGRGGDQIFKKDR